MTLLVHKNEGLGPFSKVKEVKVGKFQLFYCFSTLNASLNDYLLLGAADPGPLPWRESGRDQGPGKSCAAETLHSTAGHRRDQVNRLRGTNSNFHPNTNIIRYHRFG